MLCPERATVLDVLRFRNAESEAIIDETRFLGNITAPTSVRRVIRNLMLRLIPGGAALLACLPLALNAETTDRSPMPQPDHVLTWQELSKMPLPPSGVRISYGDAPQQFGELRVRRVMVRFPFLL
jgi:hypothetical protein